MKKPLTLIIGLFTLIVVAGCTKSSPLQQQIKLPSLEQRCDSLRPSFQKANLGKIILAADVPGTGIEEDIFYSPKDNVCYEGSIRQAEGQQSYEIYKIIPSGTGFLWETTGESDYDKETITYFEDFCALDDENVIGSSGITGIQLEERKKEELCIYIEGNILKKYQERIQELKGE